MKILFIFVGMLMGSFAEINAQDQDKDSPNPIFRVLRQTQEEHWVYDGAPPSWPKPSVTPPLLPRSMPASPSLPSQGGWVSPSGTPPQKSSLSPSQVVPSPASNPSVTKLPTLGGGEGSSSNGPPKNPPKNQQASGFPFSAEENTNQSGSGCCNCSIM